MDFKGVLGSIGIMLRMTWDESGLPSLKTSMGFFSGPFARIIVVFVGPLMAFQFSFVEDVLLVGLP